MRTVVFLFVTAIVLAMGHIKVSSARLFKCKKKIDLGLVLDASASMGEAKFGLSKKFAKELLKHFVITPSLTRVSLSYFSFYHHIASTFKDEVYSDELGNMIDDMKYEGSFTNLAKAAMGLKVKVFAKKAGARADKKDVKLVSVFMSDAYESLGTEELAFYIKELQNQGVETFAAQVNGENSIRGTEVLVTQPSTKHVFTIYRNPKKIRDEAERLARAICDSNSKQQIRIKIEVEGERM